MKAYLVAASGAAILALPVLAHAQGSDAAPTGVYGSLGYAHQDYDGPDTGTVQGRLGYRINKNLAVEGELGGGINSDTDRNGNLTSKYKLTREGAVYGVGLLPVSPNTDVYARVGYGASQIKSQYDLGGITASDKDTVKSWRVGAGAEHFLDDGKNGIRVDYTREEATHGDRDANVWSAGYVRRF
jgi:outer membrane immunogenic protein